MCQSFSHLPPPTYPRCLIFQIGHARTVFNLQCTRCHFLSVPFHSVSIFISLFLLLPSLSSTPPHSSCSYTLRFIYILLFFCCYCCVFFLFIFYNFYFLGRRWKRREAFLHYLDPCFCCFFVSFIEWKWSNALYISPSP